MKKDDGTNGAPALYANIPILNIKNEARKVEKEENNSNENKDEKEKIKISKIKVKRKIKMKRIESKNIMKKKANTKS